MFGLITSHRTILCFDRRERCVRHLPPASVDPADLVLVRGMGAAEFLVAEPDGRQRVIDVGTAAASRATEVVPASVGLHDGLAAFRFPMGHLSASPHGAIRMDAPETHDWERFGLAAADALRDVLHVARNDWVRTATGARIGREEVELADRAHLRVGPHLFPIAPNFPLSGGSDGRARHIMFRDGWMVEEFRVFRPLVFFVLMGGGAYLEQLRLATESLVAFGEYDRDVLVITDRAHDHVREALPAALHARLRFLDVQPSDKVDAVLARLMLGELPGAAAYAPILYSDTDVLFDRPLLPFLERVALTDRMSAQPEKWNELPGSSPAGGELFAADPIPIADRLGFNAGIWAMPGGAESVQVVSTIRRAVSLYLRMNGRDSLPWLDQAMANYVLRKLDRYDPALIDAATRLCQAYEPLDAASPTGFVHFWPVGFRADQRVDAMADYLRRLRTRRDGVEDVGRRGGQDASP